jgi:hypothetical protein
VLYDVYGETLQHMHNTQEKAHILCFIRAITHTPEDNIDSLIAREMSSVSMEEHAQEPSVMFSTLQGWKKESSSL